MAHAIERVHEARGQRDRVREILSWYATDNPGTLANLVTTDTRNVTLAIGTNVGLINRQGTAD